MKLRVQKRFAAQALVLYNEALMREAVGLPATPAMLLTLERFLMDFQQRMQRTETNSAWHIPILLRSSFDGPRQTMWVEFDESNVLIME